MYVYKRTERNLYTVGFYSPDGQWYSESDWEFKEDAARRVRWLNGGDGKNFYRNEPQSNFNQGEEY
jgi:hypothetical protein